MKTILFSAFLLAQTANVLCQSFHKTRQKTFFNKDSLASYPLHLPSGEKAHLPVSPKKVLVFAFLSPECPLSKNYAPKLMAIKKKYNEQVSFMAIVPGNFDAKAVQQFQKDYLPSWEIFSDNTSKLTHYLQGKVTPEIVVINNNNGHLIYKGAIDDWAVSLGKINANYANFYLDNALNDFLNNKKILISYHKPVGCFINDF